MLFFYVQVGILNKRRFNRAQAKLMLFLIIRVIKTSFFSSLFKYISIGQYKYSSVNIIIFWEMIDCAGLIILAMKNNNNNM